MNQKPRLSNQVSDLSLESRRVSELVRPQRLSHWDGNRVSALSGRKTQKGTEEPSANNEQSAPLAGKGDRGNDHGFGFLFGSSQAQKPRRLRGGLLNHPLLQRKPGAAHLH